MFPHWRLFCFVFTSRSKPISSKPSAGTAVVEKPCICRIFRLTVAKQRTVAVHKTRVDGNRTKSHRTVRCLMRMTLESVLKSIAKLERTLGRFPKRWELRNAVCSLVEDENTLRAQLSRARHEHLVHEHGDGCVRLTHTARHLLQSVAEAESHEHEQRNPSRDRG